MSDVGVPVVLLVEDQAPTRDWMRGVLIEAFPGVDVVAQRNLKEAMAWLDGAAPPWLAVIDIGLPDGSGIDIVRRLTADFPSTRRVIATIYADDAYLLDAISAGAEGYILKEEEPAQIVATLQRIERDEPPLSPSIARRILAQLRDSPAPRNDDAGLTGREVETLTLLARGLTVAEVAGRLGLRPHTVAGYVKIIYQKLGVSSRAEATREAIRRGLA
jgi:DNA-binding NarL/FixJ family response regulator